MKPEQWREKLGGLVRDLFLSPEMKHVASGSEEGVLATAKESMDIHRAYFGGMAMAMNQLS